MDNLSNGNAVINQLNQEEILVEEEIVIDPVQQKKDIKKLRLEITTHTLQIKKKLNKLYCIKPTKETYDNIININSLTI